MFAPGFLINSNNYGVVKTETVFGFGPDKIFYQNNLTPSKPLEMFFEGDFGRSFKESKISQNQLNESGNINNINNSLERKNCKKHTKRKVKKCIYKLKGKRRKHKFLKKKFILPLLIGIVAAKIFLVPVAFKALAFFTFKGLLIGFVSATILTLRGILSHSYGYHRRDDGGKRIENIYGTSKLKHLYKEYY